MLHADTAVPFGRSAEAHASVLDALSANSGLRELDLTCCALFTRANAPEPAVCLPALRSLQVSSNVDPQLARSQILDTPP